MNLREKTPERSTNVVHQSDYHRYRNQLVLDFNHRCGYCDDKDIPRAASFEIDHFVPQKMDGNRVTDYTNLVYACKSCNNAKRHKWPTGDKNKPNDGKQGWIDPCCRYYDAQFERSEDGKINPTTELGEWMYENLTMWKKQHEILWNCERLEENIKKLDELFDQGQLSEENKDKLIRLNQNYRGLLESFYGV